MANQVNVTSIDSLDAFRSSLVVFLTKARRAADDARDEVRRTRIWLQHDQRMHWENQARKWRKVLDQAQQELFSARLSGLRETSAVQEAAVAKAKRALAEAEEKLRRVKIWNRDFDGFADPLVQRLDSLRDFLDHDLPKAVTFLVRAGQTLEAYAETPAPVTSEGQP